MDYARIEVFLLISSAFVRNCNADDSIYIICFFRGVVILTIRSQFIFCQSCYSTYIFVLLCILSSFSGVVSTTVYRTL